MPQPLAFLSYTRKDDEFFGGYITAFRKTLENAVWERRALESYGFRFTLARDTQKAKSLLSGDEPFVAVISDMGRPGDSRAGITLLEWLRERRKAATPYFIYTSRRQANRKPSPGQPVPLGTTANPDELVEMVVSAVR